MSLRDCPKHGPYVADDSTDFGETWCPECKLGHDCLAVPCQEPERSALVDGEAWWQVLDRAERAEGRVIELERERAKMVALLTSLGYTADDWADE